MYLKLTIPENWQLVLIKTTNIQHHLQSFVAETNLQVYTSNKN